MKIESLSAALRAMNKIEDKRDELRLAYDKQDSILIDAWNQLEQYMIQEMKSKDLQSYAVPGQGIANMYTKRRFGASDWALVWQWINDNKCPHVLQKRLLDSAMQQYLDENGTLPPGVSTEAALKIKVTKRG